MRIKNSADRKLLKRFKLVVFAKRTGHRAQHLKCYLRKRFPTNANPVIRMLLPFPEDHGVIKAYDKEFRQ